MKIKNKDKVLTGFIIIGYLKSKDNVQFTQLSTDDKRSGYNELVHGYSYLNITPISYKFYQNSTFDMDSRTPIRIYTNTLTRYIKSTKPDFHFRDNRADTDDKRQNDIFDEFKDKLFVIQPSYVLERNKNHQFKMTKNGSKKYYVEGRYGHFWTLQMSKGNKPDIDLAPVPIFNSSNTTSAIKNKYSFKRALEQTNPLGIITVPWPVSRNDYPDGIIWEDKSGACTLFSNIDRQSVSVYRKSRKERTKGNNVIYHNSYVESVAYGCHSNNPEIVSSYNSVWFNQQYKFKHIAFIDTELLPWPDDSVNQITYHDFDKEASISKPIKDMNMDGYGYSSNDISPESVINDIDNDTSSGFTDISNKSSDINNNSNSVRSSQSNKGENITGKSSNEQDDNLGTKGDDSTNDVNKTSNIAFIHKLMYNAINQKQPEYYQEKDLIDFHSAMKSPGLVVLAGISGTGKSSLISLYADTLGIPKEQRKFIPVRPFWSDDSDLLGYVDTVHSIYQPADSGLVDILIEASKPENQDKLYLITLDEMNLARVEYYFSQFLSVLERKPENRYIYLYNSNLSNRLYNSDKYNYRIHIGDNVLFCGTINEDESTHKFTDKVLDRSNIINLHLVNFTKNDEVVDYTKKVTKDADEVPDIISTKDFDSMKGCLTLSSDQTDNINSLLWNLHLCLHRANPNLGVGRRIVNQIITYLQNIPKVPDNEHSLSFNEAIDLQLVQRVFTKLRGSKNDIGTILKTDGNGKLTDDNGTLWQILEQSPLSDFDYSKQTLLRKSGELNNYGFTL